VRQAAIKAALERKPHAFEAKIARAEHLSGCRCKKVKCLKKYCECFEAGLRCAEQCKCLDCENYETILAPKQKQLNANNVRAPGLASAVVETLSDIDIATPNLAKSRGWIQTFVREFHRSASSTTVDADDVGETAAEEELTALVQTKDIDDARLNRSFQIEDSFKMHESFVDEIEHHRSKFDESLDQSTKPWGATQRVTKVQPANKKVKSFVDEFHHEQPQLRSIEAEEEIDERPVVPPASITDLTIVIGTRLRTTPKRYRPESESVLLGVVGEEESRVKRTRSGAQVPGACKGCGGKVIIGTNSSRDDAFCSQACMDFNGQSMWENMESSEVLDLTVEEEADELLGNDLGNQSHNVESGHPFEWGSNAQQYFDTLNEFDLGSTHNFENENDTRGQALESLAFDIEGSDSDAANELKLKSLLPMLSPSMPKLTRDTSRSPRSTGLPGTCEVCEMSHDGSCGTGRFCSIKCRNRCNGLKACKSPKVHPLSTRK
jgi:hypothetical protein